MSFTDQGQMFAFSFFTVATDEGRNWRCSVDLQTKLHARGTHKPFLRDILSLHFFHITRVFHFFAVLYKPVYHLEFEPVQ